MKIYKPEDIEVGKYYYSPKIASQTTSTKICDILLGCGRRILFTEDFVDKQLVNLSTGAFIQQGENAREGLWESGFEEVETSVSNPSFVVMVK